jgi:hypothetical protein
MNRPRAITSLNRMAFAWLLLSTASALWAGPNYPLKRSANNRFLIDQSGAPFLLIGDSPQALVVGLTTEDAAMFMRNRATNGFNTIWVNLLANTYTGGKTDGSLLDGTLPFTNKLAGGYYDLTTPNEAYFAHADALIRIAATNGLNVILDPIETGGWLNTLGSNGFDHCHQYGEFIGNRYRNFTNIVWMSGNDFYSWHDLGTDSVVLAVAQGIKKKDPNHLHTVELNGSPPGGSLDDARWNAVLGLNATYTVNPTYAQLYVDYNRPNHLPNFLVEGNYERENGWTGNLTLRRQEYWTLLSGATGQLYGNHYTWQFLSGWQNNLDTPGTIQLHFAATVFATRAWQNLVPDMNHTVLTAGFGTFSTNGLVNDSDYATAARTGDGSLVMAYMPTTRSFTIDMSKLNGSATAQWFDPAGGTYIPIDGSPFTNTGSRGFTPPGTNADGDGDWLLILESTNAAGSGPVTIAPGVYNGLFAQADEPAQESSGFFTLAVTSHGTYSGRLQTGPGRFSFSGRIDPLGQATNFIHRNDGSVLRMELRFGAGNEADAISGSVTDGIWLSALLGYRAVFNARLNPAPYAGKYTLAIPVDDDESATPGGDSFATLRVDASGRATLIASLADGNEFNETAFISAAGSWPLYAPLDSGSSLLMNWLVFTNRDQDDINGVLDWIKPAGVATKLYPGGFTNHPLAIGSIYLAPAAGAALVQLADGLAEFSGGGLSPFADPIQINAGNHVTNEGSNRLSMAFSPALGTFKGAVADPSSGAMFSFRGVILQDLNSGFGFLPGNNQSSRILLH